MVQQQLQHLFDRMEMGHSVFSFDGSPLIDLAKDNGIDTMDRLAQLIYKDAYVKGIPETLVTSPDVADHPVLEPEAFLKSLKDQLSNPTRIEHDYNGVFFQLFSTGSYAFAGEKLVRFYLNVSAQGTPELVGKLSALFAERQLPYTFKCSGRPDLYAERCDVALVYVPQRFADVTFRYLEELLPFIQLRASIPLFVHPLQPGFGFAENPVNDQMSFGMNICRLLAQNLMNCIGRNIPQAEWITPVLENLKRRGYDTKALFRNPSTCFLYEFI